MLFLAEVIRMSGTLSMLSLSKVKRTSKACSVLFLEKVINISRDFLCFFFLAELNESPGPFSVVFGRS